MGHYNAASLTEICLLIIVVAAVIAEMSVLLYAVSNMGNAVLKRGERNVIKRKT